MAPKGKGKKAKDKENKGNQAKGKKSKKQQQQQQKQEESLENPQKSAPTSPTLEPQQEQEQLEGSPEKTQDQKSAPSSPKLLPEQPQEPLQDPLDSFQDQKSTPSSPTLLPEQQQEPLQDPLDSFQDQKSAPSSPSLQPEQQQETPQSPPDPPQDQTSAPSSPTIAPQQEQQPPQGFFESFQDKDSTPTSPTAALQQEQEQSPDFFESFQDQKSTAASPALEPLQDQQQPQDLHESLEDQKSEPSSLEIQPEQQQKKPQDSPEDSQDQTSAPSSPTPQPQQAPSIENLPSLPASIPSTPSATPVSLNQGSLPSPKPFDLDASHVGFDGHESDREENIKITTPPHKSRSPTPDQTATLPDKSRSTTPVQTSTLSNTSRSPTPEQAPTPSYKSRSPTPEQASTLPDKGGSPAPMQTSTPLCKSRSPTPDDTTPKAKHIPDLPKTTESNDVTAEDSTETPSTAKVAASSPADIPSVPPSVPKTKSKSSPSPQLGYYYPHPTSPVAVPPQHYNYGAPYPPSYAQPIAYPNGGIQDSPPANGMAISAAHHYPPVQRSSHNDPAAHAQQYNPYPSKMRRRSSMGHGYSNFYYGGHTQHYPTREPAPSQSQFTGNNAGSLNGEQDLADTATLLHRIQNVLPDLNRLMANYREVQGELSAREVENKQIEAQHEQSLLHKEFYIEALQTQMRKAANESAEECSKLKRNISELRMELAGLQEQRRDAQESLAQSQKANGELTRVQSELEKEVERLQKNIQDERGAHERELGQLGEKQKKHEREVLAEQKEEMEGYFQQIKDQDDKLAAEQLKEREDELINEQESLKAKWETEKKNLVESQQEMETAYESKLETKQSEIDTKQGELDDKQAEVDAKGSELESKITELETKQTEIDAKQTEIDTKQGEVDEKQDELASKQVELDSIQDQLASKQTELDSKQTELVSKEEELGSLRTELEETKRADEEELSVLREALQDQTNAVKDFEERLAALVDEHQQKEESWQKAREDFEEKLSQKSEELKLTYEEKEALAIDGHEREERLQSVVEEMRQTHDNLNKDRERLKKTLHSLGEATDMKIKGDSFFLECFTKLSGHIVELSKDFFTYMPIEPPSDILAKIPSDIPQFLDNTPASREVRSAYIQHFVSKTLTYRVFQPFLFTLSRRYDKADTFFQMLSTDIRRKSVRREAFWRQQTLKAAYTTSDAKQAINVVAAVIVDEIVDHIRHFTDPKHLDALLANVRAIVKLAAETWRLARVERELIIVTMPSAEDEQTEIEEWQEFAYDSSSTTLDAAIDPVKKPLAERRTLLCTLPRIYREAVHEDFLAENIEKATPCTYFPGVILYADSPTVATRRAELSKTVEGSVDAPEARSTTPDGVGRNPPLKRHTEDQQTETKPEDIPSTNGDKWERTEDSIEKEG